MFFFIIFDNCIRDEDKKREKEKREKHRRIVYLRKNSRETFAKRDAFYKEYRKALRSGVLKRQKCEKCGKLETSGHHEDYSKPLKVRWLCKTCHSEVHSMLKY